MTDFVPGSARYVGLAEAPVGSIDLGSLFSAMTDDLVRDGDVDLALQKAFRWGFEDDAGERQPGLRDLMQRLREDRAELLEEIDASAEAGEGEGSDAEPSEDDAVDPEAHAGQAAQMQQLEHSLRAIENLEDIAGLDPDLAGSLLTDAEKNWLDQWSTMRGTLAAEGLVIETGDRLELTPRAVRRIGEHVLRSIFLSVREPGDGDHEMRRRGRTGSQTETSTPWQFGDPFALDLSQTIMNSIVRRGATDRVRLAAQDFEIYERESRGSVASVLLIDMSRSMFYNGCWDAAKRSALALDTLMRTRFQRDDLEIVGFSERAQRLTLTDLPALAWDEYSHGTNLEDGLRLARELLRPFGGKTRQVVLLTDGEPTAWLDGDEVRFEHPPTDRVFDATLREVARCTREKIRINTFLLQPSAAMTVFAERYSRLNRGRLIHVDPASLGHYLLRDFMEQRAVVLR